MSLKPKPQPKTDAPPPRKPPRGGTTQSAGGDDHRRKVVRIVLPPKKTLPLLFIAALLALPTAFGQIPGVAKSHIEANVPEAKNFRAFLVRDLTTHLKPRYGDRITVDYEMLRESATQSGVAYPKFYLWVTVTKEDQTKLEGAARVAAIEKKEFGVTSFLTREEIAAKPTSIEGVFPQLLVAKIREKAGIKK